MTLSTGTRPQHGVSPREPRALKGASVVPEEGRAERDPPPGGHLAARPILGQVHPADRGISQVYSPADQQVHGLVKSARTWPHAGRCRRTPCGVAAAPVTGRRGPVRRGTAARRAGAANVIEPGVPNGHGQTAADERHATTRSSKRPTNPAQGARRAGTRCWRAPSVAVRANADGAHRPS